MDHLNDLTVSQILHRLLPYILILIFHAECIKYDVFESSEVAVTLSVIPLIYLILFFCEMAPDWPVTGLNSRTPWSLTIILSSVVAVVGEILISIEESNLALILFILGLVFLLEQSNYVGFRGHLIVSLLVDVVVADIYIVSLTKKFGWIGVALSIIPYSFCAFMISFRVIWARIRPYTFTRITAALGIALILYADELRASRGFPELLISREVIRIVYYLALLRKISPAFTTPHPPLAIDFRRVHRRLGRTKMRRG